MKNFIKIEIDASSDDEAEILMAELSENDFYAFEQNENLLIAYTKEEDFNEERFKSLLPKSSVYEYSVIANKNWNEEWESQLQPVIINDFAGIRASFHEPLTSVQHEIIITPKMSFGTGHHATTFLMVAQMEKLDFKGKSVLDFGTGTGILAILAEKLGAASVIAIDNDEWSVNNALENIEANRSKRIDIMKRNNIEGLPVVNIIVANINFSVLTENAGNMAKLLQAGSLLIISGFLLKDEEDIAATFVKNNFRKREKGEKNEWVVMVFEKC